METGTKISVLNIALAGNANVGKSAIFNQLTGLVQETGNWPGKTVGIREDLETSRPGNEIVDYREFIPLILILRRN